MAPSVTQRSIEDLPAYIESLGPIAVTAARIALNQTVRRDGLRAARSAIYGQVAYPAGYLDTDRLRQGRTATDTRLEASIVGRERPTSLARFVRGPVAFGRKLGTITVQVKPGQSRKLERAFFMPLRSGSVRTETVFNLGLAIRLKPGEHLESSVAAYELPNEPGVFLLYGPSVAQVFQTVAVDIAPTLGKIATDEFFRQFARLV